MRTARSSRERLGRIAWHKTRQLRHLRLYSISWVSPPRHSRIAQEDHSWTLIPERLGSMWSRRDSGPSAEGAAPRRGASSIV